MLLKLPAKFCPLAERLGTNKGRIITSKKEVTLFPDYFFSWDNSEIKENHDKLKERVCNGDFKGCAIHSINLPFAR